MHVFRSIKTTSSSAAIASELATLELPAKKSEGREDAPPTKPLNVTVARIGQVALVGVGCELLTEVGMEIKEGSPFEYTFVITHCNGKAGYLPPKHLYEEGGYEINSTGFALRRPESSSRNRCGCSRTCSEVVAAAGSGAESSPACRLPKPFAEGEA